MDNKRLLSYGYLFKELPPPFSSESLGVNYNLLPRLHCFITKCIEYSIPKGQYSRRILHLPHPRNFIQIVNHICDLPNWTLLQNHYTKSTYSHSKVIENLEAGSNILNKHNRAIKTNYDNVNDSKERTVIDSYDMLYELKLDIAKFYPSIYTHSLVWAILGKDRAKELWRLKGAKAAEPDFNLYDFADKLDTYVRNAQDNQSVGIPIGPDTSHIVAEVIGTYIDKQLKDKFPEVKVIRFFDDFHLYLDSEEKAQMALKYIHQILADLQLSLNENKLNIRKFPFAFQESWVKEINDVHFVKVIPSNIKQYFSTLFGLVNNNPEKSNTIFNYALKTFEKRTTVIPKKYWTVFESLLLKSILVEPSVLEIASRIFETYKTFVNTDKIKKVMEKLLEYHSDLNHHYEIVWALWFYKQFDLQLHLNATTKIINSGDNFSILLLLDLNSKGKISDGGLTKDILQMITDILDLDPKNNWLLYYEAVEVKKWISAVKRADLSIFSRTSISFYDTGRTIKIFDLPE